MNYVFFFFFSSRRRHTRFSRDWSSDVCSSDLAVDQLRPSAGRAGADGRTETAVEVLASETERLERLAGEFSEFGRLPQGPKSEVELVDLMTDLSLGAVEP